MKIVVIGAAQAQEIDWALVYPGADIEWVKVDRPEQTKQSGDIDLFIDLGFNMDRDRIGKLKSLLPSPILINAVGPTLREIGQPFIRINAWSGFLERSIHELASIDQGMTDRIALVYQQLGKPYKTVPDIPGMISGRILATLINEAYFTLQEEVSTMTGIDTAMKLGTNYPMGPFEWCERIGKENIFELLSLLSKTESRYAPSKALEMAVGKIKIELKNN
jgi:3-hydroxybutyryl-CoA dehydrogenase